MNSDFENVAEFLESLCNLQERQIKEFASDPAPDIAIQSEERNVAFSQLKTVLNPFLLSLTESQNTQGVQVNSERLEFCRERIVTLMKQNDVIKHQITDYRDRVRESMKAVSQGKRALNSYRGGSGTSKAMSFSS